MADSIGADGIGTHLKLRGTTATVRQRLAAMGDRSDD
jgi:hypothetical protein